MQTALYITQILFFTIGAYYFLIRCKKDKKQTGNPISFEENMNGLDRLNRMKSVSLTKPLSEELRPTSLDQIIGQEKGIQALRGALCGENPQHILIYGPPGVGKTTAARLILEEAKQKTESPFQREAPFIELDATVLQFDERNITDPLMGSVHDPIYQGAGAYGAAGVPNPKLGAISDAHGGILFIDEIGELHPLQMNKLLKILEDRRAYFQSGYYSKSNKNIPPYIHEIFQNGVPSDFRLIGATTKRPEDIPEALRSRCTEIFFDNLKQEEIETIASNTLKQLQLPAESNLFKKVAEYTHGGRDTVNLIQSMFSLARLEQKAVLGLKELELAINSFRYHKKHMQTVSQFGGIGVVNGLAVQGNLGVVLVVEASVRPSASAGLLVTGIVEEEEFQNRGHHTKRKSTAKSSAEIVLTLMETFGFQKNEHHVHINFPGGIPIDGPSAGVAMFLAVYSAYFQKELPCAMALTGEISLTGEVLPVGGVEEKIEAAILGGAKEIYIPKENHKKKYRELAVEVEPVESVSELIFYVFGQKKRKNMPEVSLEKGKVTTA
ncbi:MAG: S16 family serine protease [Bacillota bacterium]